MMPPLGWGQGCQSRGTGGWSLHWLPTSSSSSQMLAPNDAHGRSALALEDIDAAEFACCNAVPSLHCTRGRRHTCKRVSRFDRPRAPYDAYSCGRQMKPNWSPTFARTSFCSVGCSFQFSPIGKLEPNSLDRRISVHPTACAEGLTGFELLRRGFPARRSQQGRVIHQPSVSPKSHKLD